MPWICQKCGYTVFNNDVLELMDVLQQKIKCLGYDEPIEIWEGALNDLQVFLHPNNYLCMNVKRTLIQLYGNREKFELPADVTKISRKIELCKNHINVYSKVDNGYSSWKGKVLEELVGPYMLYNKYLLKSCQIDENAYFKNYKESLRMIKEASKCRQYEPQSSAKFFAWCLKDVNDVMSDQ